MKNYTQEIEEYLAKALEAEERGDFALSHAYLECAARAEQEGEIAWAIACSENLD